MKIFDVSLTIRPGMPVWPGDDAVDLHRKQKIEDGANANVSFLGLSVHTGTHVDAPYHFLQDGKTVEQLALDVLVGSVQIIEIPESANVIDRELLTKLDFNPGIQRVLFKTRNSSYWLLSDQTFQTGFVGITKDGSEFLVEHGIKLVGIDYLSISPYKNSRPTHEVLLKAQMVIIEGLDLNNIAPGIYKLYCLPIKLGGSDGAPARVILTQE
jgi:arylformamidase